MLFAVAGAICVVIAIIFLIDYIDLTQRGSDLLQTAHGAENTKTKTNTNTNTNTHIQEDELIVCNFKGECKIIAIDNYMEDKAIKKLWNKFNHHVDTFDVDEVHD